MTRSHVLLPVFLLIASTCQARLTLVDHGTSDYRIVIAADADSAVRKAANELQHFLAEMSGAALPIVTDRDAATAHEILVGRSRRTGEFFADQKAALFAADAFIVRTQGERLLILGGAPRGTLYGVYTLLEEQLGCRRYSAAVTVIPRRSTVTLDDVDIRRAPFFTHREIHYLNAMDREYADWHKLHNTADRDAAWGMWVHTFERLLPSDRFFAPHPEWYTLQGDRRIPSGQLCLTNPEVFPVLCDSLGAQIARKSGARYWSVSQNDNYNECRCAQCQAANVRFGGSSGTMIDFVNRVAERFPDRVISTLAYQYTRSAPAHAVPAPNVNIMLCSIECNRSRPIDSDPSSVSFRKDVEDWGKLTGNILMWDYVVQFRNLVSPFPNLRVLQPNIQFFARNGIRMMFQQGCGHNVGEFGELRTYLIAKLLWNPDVNVDSVMDDFLNGYYGAAGPHIRRYIDRMHDALAQSGGGLACFGNPYDAIGTYLTPALIREYSKMFDDAERAVAAAPDMLERVRIARLPLEYAILEISLREVDPMLSYFDKTGPVWKVRSEMRERLEQFVSFARKAGIERLEERGTSPDEYRASIEQQLVVSVEGNLAYSRPVTLHTQPSEKYPVGGAKALTDGLHGPNDYHCNWLGFEGEHLDAVIDLGAVRPIHAVKTRFLQQWYSWIWLPRRVEFLVSEDGERYTSLRSIENTVSEERPGSFSAPFDVEAVSVRARYVRVKAQSLLHCPDWHIGAGGKCWIFIDEIVVE
jgi:hypothetical protein